MIIFIIIGVIPLAISEAFRHGQASAVAPFEYTALAWAVALDWLVWQAVSDFYTLAGGAIIIASGIYLNRRETPQADGGGGVAIAPTHRAPPGRASASAGGGCAGVEGGGR